MIITTITISKLEGLHMRPTMLLHKHLEKARCNVTFIKDGSRYNGKELLSLLSMGAVYGDRIMLEIEGEEEIKVEKTIVDFLCAE